MPDDTGLPELPPLRGLRPGSRLRRSAHVSFFEHMGAVYAYHDLIGYVLQMSADVVDLLDVFGEAGRDPGDVVRDPLVPVDRDQAVDFVTILFLQSCLVEADADERAALWEMHPVHGPWVLVHRPGPGRVTLLTARLDRIAEERLVGWEAVLWDRATGNRTARELYDDVVDGTPMGDRPPSEDEFLDTLTRFVHHDRQFLRMSAEPVRTYRRGVNPMPPYLRSTMPYPERSPGAAPEEPLAEARRVSAATHYRGDRRAPEDRFDLDETTLSHLFREPHEALGGGTYASALVDLLAARGALGPAGGRILEIGGGTGALAAGVLAELARRWPEAVARTTYTILDLSPALRDGQAAALDGLPIRPAWIAGDVEETDLGEAAYDLVLCNEMVGDLTTLRLERDEIDALQAGRDVSGLLPVHVALLRRHPAALDPVSLPETFHVNAGAWLAMERIARALAPGGTAWVTEFGEEMRYPVLSDHLDHPEFSIHFGHLRQVARDAGLAVEFGEVVDLLGFDREVQVLGSTRGQFQALRHLAAAHGVRLAKQAWTPETLAAALGPALPLASLEGLRFERLDQRVMGLSPLDFKALVCGKPR